VIENLAADVTSPVSRVDRDERHALLRRAVDALAEADRQIIVLRHFDDFGNSECAEILGIEPKAASIRYVRALERLQKKLMELSCFRKA
jgi:RNA polymerase sigma-70 factor (ECF subfamily)